MAKRKGIIMYVFLKTLLISAIPSIITSFSAITIANKNAKNQISVFQERIKHDQEQLIRQHSIDIDNLKEKHRLEMQAKDQDHKHQLEIQEKDHRNAMLLKEKENEGKMALEGIKMLSGAVGSFVASPEGVRLINDAVMNKSSES